MIIWINGPYGVGKSTLAEKLHRKIENSFVFDAEAVGNAVRDNMPPQFFKPTFEELPLWHEMCCRLLKELDSVYDGCVLVPMTLTRPESHRAILERLRQENVELRHILLISDYDTIHDRILARGEKEDCWCMRQIRDCLEKQKDYPCDFRLCSIGKSAEALAQEVIRVWGAKHKKSGPHLQ